MTDAELGRAWAAANGCRVATLTTDERLPVTYWGWWRGSHEYSPPPVVQLAMDGRQWFTTEEQAFAQLGRALREVWRQAPSLGA